MLRNQLLNGAILAMLFGAGSLPCFAGYVLFGDGYEPQTTDTFVEADAGACCTGQYFSLTNNYLAQTFKATGAIPLSLTIGLANNFGGADSQTPFNFRLLFTTAPSGFAPGPVLWESIDLSIPATLSGFHEYTFLLSNLMLDVDSNYAWILDTYTTGEGTESAGAYFANIGLDAPAYADGALFFQSSSGLGRNVDFARPWVNSGFDAAFLIRYAVPEPSSAALAFAALCGLGALRARRT